MCAQHPGGAESRARKGQLGLGVELCFGLEQLVSGGAQMPAKRDSSRASGGACKRREQRLERTAGGRERRRGERCFELYWPHSGSIGACLSAPGGGRSERVEFAIRLLVRQLRPPASKLISLRSIRSTESRLKADSQRLCSRPLLPTSAHAHTRSADQPRLARISTPAAASHVRA